VNPVKIPTQPSTFASPPTKPSDQTKKIATDNQKKILIIPEKTGLNMRQEGSHTLDKKWTCDTNI